MRKNIYELSRLYAQGLVSREDYLEARRALIHDILTGRQELDHQLRYPSLKSSEDATAHYSDGAIRAQRRMARDLQARLQEFRSYASTARRARQRRLLRWGATLFIVLAGAAWVILGNGAASPW